MPLSPDQKAADGGSSGIQKLNLPAEDRTRIGNLATQLGEEFKNSSGRTIQECLSGSLDDSSMAHSFLFGKAASEPDPVARKDIVFAHLALELEHNKKFKVQSVYDDSVGKSGMPLKDVYPGLYHTEQMVPDNSEIAKGHQGEKLVIPTAEMADEFVKFADYYLEVYKAIEGKQLPADISREEVAAVMATQRISIEYFGFPNEYSSAKNVAKYITKKAKLTDFKGENSAVCTEFGALAQQMLSFAGAKVRLVSGGPMVIGDEEGNFDNPNVEGHVFNVLSAKENGTKTFIFDPSNALLMQNESDPTSYVVKPYLAPLSEDAYKTFVSAQDTVINHAGTHRIYSRV